jgi:integrase
VDFSPRRADNKNQLVDRESYTAMSLFKPKGSAYWHYLFTIHKQRYSGSTKTTNKALARKIEEAKRQEVIEHSMLGEAREFTLGEALELVVQSKQHLASIRDIQGTCRKLLGYRLDPHTGARKPCFGLDPTLTLSALQPKHVQQLIIARRQEGGSNAAIHVELCTLSQALKLAKSLGYQVSLLDITDLKRANAVKPHKRRVRYLSLEEEQRLLTELDPKRRVSPDKVSMAQDVYDLVVLLLDTGARHSEITHLQWHDVHLDRGTLNLYRSKVKNEAVLVLTERARQVLQRRAVQKTSAYVFTDRDKAGPRKYAALAFKKACQRAGLPQVTFHTLRHTFSSRLVQHGVSLYQLQQLLGHTSQHTSSLYAHLTPNHAAQTATEILNRLQPPPTN